MNLGPRAEIHGNLDTLQELAERGAVDRLGGEVTAAQRVEAEILIVLEHDDRVAVRPVGRKCLLVADRIIPRHVIEDPLRCMDIFGLS